MSCTLEGGALVLNKARTSGLLKDGHKDKQDSVDIKG